MKIGPLRGLRVHRLMERQHERSQALSQRYLLIALLCMPLAYGVVYFLRLCKEAQGNPDKYLDSPASFGVGCIYAGIFALPALIGIMMILLRKKRQESRQ